MIQVNLLLLLCQHRFCLEQIKQFRGRFKSLTQRFFKIVSQFFHLSCMRCSQHLHLFNGLLLKYLNAQIPLSCELLKLLTILLFDLYFLSFMFFCKRIFQAAFGMISDLLNSSKRLFSNNVLTAALPQDAVLVQHRSILTY